jgi:ribokinase
VPSGQPCVAVVGSLNTDLVTYLEDVPQSGQTVFGRSFATGFGGKGSNQAAMASMCGAEVFMVGCLGDDTYGAATRTHLGELGISSEFVGTAPTSSGVALIWVEKSGANRIVIVAGANGHNTPEQARLSITQMKRPQVVVGQFEIPTEVTASAFVAAKEIGATTVLNPAPAMRLPDFLLQTVDWLAPNEHEFEMIFGYKPTEKGIDDAAAQLFDDRKSAKGKGTSSSYGLIVTLGEKGAAVWASDSPGVEMVSANQVEAIDTTGAGDAFVGAFSVALASGFKPAQAALAGCLCATESVKKPGAQESFPSKEFAKQAFLAASNA